MFDLLYFRSETIQMSSLWTTVLKIRPFESSHEETLVRTDWIQKKGKWQFSLQLIVDIRNVKILISGPR